MKDLDIRKVNVVRYVTPLREGGSLPALVEADDEFLYVIKFRGAGQGPKALIAELIGGELARACGLLVPELVFMTLDESFGRSEPDEEIQDLLRFSIGLNLGLHYLSGSIMYDPLASPVDALTASKVVILDSLITNIDRTYKNPNLLSWNKELWLIDHGAALYFHHAWDGALARSRSPFVQIRDHVLLPMASRLAEIDADMAGRLDCGLVRDIVAAIPDAWLVPEPGFASIGAHRAASLDWLQQRIETPRGFVEEAIRAHAALV